MAVLHDHGVGLVQGVVQELAHLLVDDPGGLGAEAGSLPLLHAHEDLLVTGQCHLAHGIAHAQLHDHGAGDLGGVLQVAGGAGGDVVEDALLHGVAAHGVGQAVQQLVARLVVAVLGGDHHGVAAGAAARQDRHFGDRRGVVQRRRHQGMAALVVGGHLPLAVAHHLGIALRAHGNAVDGLVQGAVVDDLVAGAGRQQRRLVQHIGEVRTGHADGAAGHGLEVHVVGQRLALGMHGQDVQAALEVRDLHRDLAVEAARAQQGRVQDVHAVGGRDQDDVLVLVEPVHLHQHLVQGLLTLVVTAAHAGASMAAHGVDLVDEDDRRGVLLGGVEQVAHAAGAHTHEHLHEVRAGDRVEGHVGLAGHGAGQQGLAGAGRAVQQHALGDLGAHGLVLARIDQELLDLVELLDGLLGAGDVREGDLGGLLVEQLRLGLAELHGPAAALGVHDQEPEQAEEDQQRQEGDQQCGPPGAGGDLVGVALGGLCLLHGLHDRLTAGVDVAEAHLRALVVLAVLEGLGEHQVHALLVAADDLGLLDGAALQQLEALFGVDLLEAVTAQQGEQGHAQQQRQDDPQRDARAGSLLLADLGAAGVLPGVLGHLSPRRPSA